MMRAMTVLTITVGALWQSSAWAQAQDASDPPPLQRVYRLPEGGTAVTSSSYPVTTVVQQPATTPRTFAGPEATCCPERCCPEPNAVAVAPVPAGRYYAYRPVVSLSPKLTNYHIGRGIIGQPTVYVPGQPVRNFLRYLSP